MPKFRRKPVIVEAVKITSPITIETAEGTLTGKAGDYLITHADGTQYPCNADTFKQTYEPIKVDIRTFVYKVLRKVKHKLKTQ
ncbi:hypothetical protein BKP45_13815 [Anaerobacillus alkalidiazotrophicus]|uniref:Uncharacterized protein n=1 Tax=Anaerobacillus alkalidiazotrophicus TaxID=472963 RepID=A0A1S2M3E6_9BACI|nr:hypothetical protein [Anaerobacillus alkalidiazotrophicus]OIJ19231.1 hypothetical protein BKP45_13815 [Anaerobacillus alkalidiazotrophicus]